MTGKRLEKEEERRQIVMKLLKENAQGLTIADLSSRTQLSRITIRAILANLLGSQKVIVRTVGQAKLNYWNYSKE